jgi:hypothetical protein
MNHFLKKIKLSLINSTNGTESYAVVSWIWGGLFYFIFLFFAEDFVRNYKFDFIGKSLSALIVLYSIWHIYAVIKCAPKKPKLTEEEIKILKLNRPSFLNSFSRKLFLQEPITKIESKRILILIDAYLIVHFFGFIW